MQWTDDTTLPSPNHRRSGYETAPSQGDNSSRTRPLVSMANCSVTSPPTSAIAANAANTYWMPKSPTIHPTITGPIEDPALSHALPKPVPTARRRVGLPLLTLAWLGATSATEVLILATATYAVLQTIAFSLYLYSAELSYLRGPAWLAAAAEKYAHSKDAGRARRGLTASPDFSHVPPGPRAAPPSSVGASLEAVYSQNGMAQLVRSC